MKKWVKYLVIPLCLLMLFTIGMRFYLMNGVARQLASAYQWQRPLIIAHRGASFDAPESTQIAYEKAIEMKADFLEADIQMTKDGHLIIFHDETLQRTTNVEAVFPNRVNDPVSSFTLDELKMLDCGSWFNEAFPDRAKEQYSKQKVMTLDQLVEMAKANHKGLYLETKSIPAHQGVEEKMIRLLEEHDMLEKTIFQSFNIENLKTFAQLAADVPRVYLINKAKADELGMKAILDYASPYVQGVGCVGYLGLPQNTRQIRKHGLMVHHYTINSAAEMRALKFLGSDGFFTDRPDLAHKTLR